MRGSNADWLFPGESGNHKEKISFSTQIVEFRSRPDYALPCISFAMRRAP
jgi:hypothetical protein